MKYLKKFENVQDLDNKYYNSDYVSQICDKLNYKLLKNSKTIFNSGTQGVVWILENNKILKITTDFTEVIFANKIKGKKLERISNVYDVKKVNNEVYVIILELLDSFDDKYFSLFENYDKLKSKYYRAKHRNISYKETFKEFLIKEGNMEVLKLYNDMKLIEQEALNNGISKVNDIWQFNLGLKKGKLAAFDLGENIEYAQNIQTLP